MPEALTLEPYPDGTAIPDFTPPPIGSDEKPKLSILLITYNHGKYIGAAIESILKQKTTYTYRIHVIEDCSTDHTQDVVMRYAAKYPSVVIPFFNKVNIGHKGTQLNFIRGMRTMNGEYFAILEGDDYWSDDTKIQKQLDFLEANPDFVGTAHNTVKIYEDNSQAPHRFLYYENTPEEHTVEDMIYIRSFFHASSLIFRNVYQGNPPEYFSNRWSCDIFVNIALSQFGKIRYFDEDMSIYRAHGGGMFSTMDTLKGWHFNVGGLRRYNAWLNYRYHKSFSRSIARYCRVVLRESGKNGVDKISLSIRMKYFLLHWAYLLSYAILELPQAAWRYEQKTMQRTQRYIPTQHPLLRSMATVVFFPFFLALSLAFIVGRFLLYVVKDILLALLPLGWKQRILFHEHRYPNLRKLRLLLFYGNPFSKEGKEALWGIAASVLYTINKLVYRGIAFITPSFAKQRLKRFEARYPAIAYYHDIIRRGQLFHKDGRQFTAYLAGVSIRRLLKPRRNAA